MRKFLSDRKYFTTSIRIAIMTTMFFLLTERLFAQVVPISVSDGSDPGSMKSRVVLDLESYFYEQPAQFYYIRAGFLYGLQNERHLLGISVPFVHNIFEEDYQGYENTTGIGDIRMAYMAAFPTGKSIGLSRVSPYLDVSAPTGDSQLGRGAGTWLYKPGVLFKFQATPEVSFYPEVRFQFSGEEANSQGGSDGMPDPEDPDADGKLQNLSFQIPAVIQLESAQAWLALNAQYMQSLTEDEYFIFLRTDFGKMIGTKTAASLSISKFIAGQPRLNVWVQAKFQFFL
jgi:hypothetical protein